MPRGEGLAKKKKGCGSRPERALVLDIGCGNSLALERLLAGRFGHRSERVEVVKARAEGVQRSPRYSMSN